MPDSHPLRTLARRAHQFAEGVAALLLAVIFVGFIIQVVFRYAFNFPAVILPCSVLSLSSMACNSFRRASR